MAIKCADVAFFLTVLLENNYLRMYWTYLYQIFSMSTHVSRHDQSDLLFAIALGRCYGNRFWHQSAQISMFCALAFHNVWGDRNINKRVITAVTHLRLLKFDERCSSNPWVIGGSATRWDLPRISSFVSLSARQSYTRHRALYLKLATVGLDMTGGVYEIINPTRSTFIMY